MKKILLALFCIVFLLAVAAGVFAPLVLRGQNSSAAPVGNTTVSAVNTADAKRSAEPGSAPIVKLQLFKNGFGFVTREIAARNWSEPMVLNPAITPRHGTLWFAPAETTIRRTTRERVVTGQSAADNDAPGYRPDWSSMTDVYEWKQVTLKLKDGSELSGVVVGNQKPKTDEQPQPAEIMDSLSAAYRSSSSFRISSSAAPKSLFGASFLTIKTEGGDYITVRQDDVAKIRAASMSDGKLPSPQKTVTEEVQFVEAPKDHLGPVMMRYLSDGVTWSPFYRVDLRDDGKLAISASASILNDLEDFENVEVELISGFPNMAFASSLSALSKGMTFQNFLNNLANPNSPSYLRSGVASNIMSQSVFSNSAPAYDDIQPAGPQPSLWSTSGMDDMQYKSAGRLSMKKGDVLQLPIASKTADFEYVTTWTAPMEKRFSFGEGSGDATLWNCVRFRNPFDFALTTAPYEIERNGQVLGQSTGTWFGAGDPATVKITKSMAVSASITQVESGNQSRYYTEQKGTSEYKYHYPDVTANIVLKNRSPKEVKMVLESAFFGELIEADGKPSKLPQPTDSRTRNSKTKLVWEVAVPASGRIELSYTYKVILDN